jgi:ABC-type molybdate transport system ATPase subunit
MAVHIDTAIEGVIVQLAVGTILMLAEVTRDAIGRLGIGVGQRLHVLIKSVSIELQASDAKSATDISAV